MPNRQGGQLVHNAADQLSADNTAKVNSGTPFTAAPHFLVYC